MDSKFLKELQSIFGGEGKSMVLSFHCTRYVREGRIYGRCTRRGSGRGWLGGRGGGCAGRRRNCKENGLIRCPDCWLSILTI
ncbi:hypothetical protein QJS04_geneDACA001332 [Acorus gramineus]|uniref:Uncharacterized protein n=1 Tax=Acorus gramineus TaxID=55184 RepID=A0AAV9AEJ7_ACOGR|nr:hypothetical protein QJS04_geneDACA001332 [Acorus gramineus]